MTSALSLTTVTAISSRQYICRSTYTSHLWRQELRCFRSVDTEQSTFVLLTIGHQLWTIQTATENISVLDSSTAAYRDCLLICALQILLLTYLLTAAMFYDDDDTGGDVCKHVPRHYSSRDCCEISGETHGSLKRDAFNTELFVVTKVTGKPTSYNSQSSNCSRHIYSSLENNVVLKGFQIFRTLLFRTQASRTLDISNYDHNPKRNSNTIPLTLTLTPNPHTNTNINPNNSRYLYITLTLLRSAGYKTAGYEKVRVRIVWNRHHHHHHHHHCHHRHVHAPCCIHILSAKSQRCQQRCRYESFKKRHCSIRSFLPRCMECRRGIVMRILSVRPSVCLCLSVCPSHAWIVTKR